MLEVPKLRGCLPGRQEVGADKERVFCVSETERAKSSKPLTSDMWLQDSKCALPGFGLALVPPHAPFFPFCRPIFLHCVTAKLSGHT